MVVPNSSHEAPGNTSVTPSITIDASVFESPAGYKVEKGVPKMR